ncbi:peptidylprolyl isomerase [Oculatella sp. FACHB-28]|uniref:peptidylprolyl isomerase n=1 Tax=Oculatella sp. FACHB-28 TaxID=2692845 RepID=UPI0016865174|nr:peptidylprolyl isomerase [Oculatella sp. FACHB-28]
MKIMINQWVVSVFVVVALLVGGCSPAADTTSTTDPAATETASVPAVEASPQAADLPRLEGEATVEMVVNGSTITIQVDGTNAPITAGNFVDLVQRGVYDGLTFHRVVKQPEPFVVQGGDPQGSDPNFPAEQLGTGGFIDPDTSAPRYIPLEIKPEGTEEPVYSQTLDPGGAQPVLKHTRGAVAMARSNLPDSASSQFYFALSDLSFLDGSYAVFGYVTEGMDAVDQIQQGDRIESARVTAGAENLQGGGAAASTDAPTEEPQ